jgi:hypothetical protein
MSIFVKHIQGNFILSQDDQVFWLGTREIFPKLSSKKLIPFEKTVSFYNRGDSLALIEQVTDNKKKQGLKELKVCLAFPINKQKKRHYQDLVVRSGGIIHEDVTKSTDIFVTDDSDLQSQKAKNAVKYEKKIMNELEFIDFLKQHNQIIEFISETDRDWDAKSISIAPFIPGSLQGRQIDKINLDNRSSLSLTLTDGTFMFATCENSMMPGYGLEFILKDHPFTKIPKPNAFLLSLDNVSVVLAESTLHVLENCVYSKSLFLNQPAEKDKSYQLTLPSNDFDRFEILNDNFYLCDKINRWYLFKKIDKLTDPVHIVPLLPYEKYDFSLSSSNSLGINQNYLIDSNQKLYQLNPENFANLELINFPLEKNEKLLTIENLNRWGGTILALTSHGRVFGLGKNNEFNLKVGTLATDELIKPILLNPHLLKKQNPKHFIELIDNHKDNQELLKTIFHTIPEEFYNDFDIAKQYVQFLKFVPSRSIRFKEKIIMGLINEFPERALNVLHFAYSLDDFRKPSLIDSMSKLIPEFILLFQNRMYGEKPIPVDTYIQYLKPLIHKKDGKLKSLSELYQRPNHLIEESSNYLFDFDERNLVDNIEYNVPNFYSALAKLNISFNFISYRYYLIHDSRGGSLSQEVVNKIESDCSLTILPEWPIQRQIELLVSQNLFTLAKRLIEANIIPKGKFLDYFQKSPKEFSITFKSMLIASTKLEKVNKTKVRKDFSIHKIFSDSGSTVLLDNQHRLFQFGGTNYFRAPGTKYGYHYIKPTLSNELLLKEQVNVIDLWTHRNMLTLKIDTNETFIVENSVLKKTSRFELLNNEIPLQILFDDSIVWLTETHRVIYENTKELIHFGTKLNSINNDEQIDITPILPLKKAELVEEIQKGTRETLLFLRTSKQRIIAMTEDGGFSTLNLELFLDESIKQFQVSYYGIIVLTSLNRVLLSIFDQYQKIHNDASLKFSILNELDGKSKVKQVAIHHDHGLILMENGTIFMFGSYLTIRQDQTSELIPLPLSFLKSNEIVVQCYLGFRRTFLLTSEDRLFSFGDNRNYVLGDGTKVDREFPVEITKYFK